MSRAISEVYNDALELNQEDRADLAGLLLESLEVGKVDAIESFWKSEVVKRANEIDENPDQRIAWSEVLDDLHKRLNPKHPVTNFGRFNKD